MNDCHAIAISKNSLKKNENLSIAWHNPRFEHWMKSTFVNTVVVMLTLLRFASSNVGSLTLFQQRRPSIKPKTGKFGLKLKKTKHEKKRFFENTKVQLWSHPVSMLTLLRFASTNVGSFTLFQQRRPSIKPKTGKLGWSWKRQNTRKSDSLKTLRCSCGPTQCQC